MHQCRETGLSILDTCMNVGVPIAFERYHATITISLYLILRLGGVHFQVIQSLNSLRDFTYFMLKNLAHSM
jgi:hypothetical protein